MSCTYYYFIFAESVFSASPPLCSGLKSQASRSGDLSVSVHCQKNKQTKKNTSEILSLNKGVQVGTLKKSHQP